MAGALGARAGLFEAGVPTLGICYGFQAMALELGGTVANSDIAEYGRTDLTVIEEGELFAGLPEEEKERLVRQHSCMTEYSEILGERIAAFTA